MFALAAVLVVLMLPSPRVRVLPLTLRLIVSVAAIALACDISVLVIGVGVHYFTDTIAGAALGTGMVAATALVLDLPGARRWLAAANGRLRNLRIHRGRKEALRG
jgi:membrane-associated phospholipid phosphatase